MPNHFLSKRDHLHDKAKWGLHEVGKRMVGGQPVRPSEHKKHKDLHAEADATEHRYLCCVCFKTFVPKPWPKNKHLIIFAHGVTLPGGEHRRPDFAPDGVQRDLPLAVCPGCCEKTSIVKAVEHDWDQHDHRARPLKGSKAGRLEGSKVRTRKRKPLLKTED